MHLEFGFHPPQFHAICLGYEIELQCLLQFDADVNAKDLKQVYMYARVNVERDQAGHQKTVW